MPPTGVEPKHRPSAHTRSGARLLLTIPLMLSASTAWGWATAEHIRLGQQIAKPFEIRLGVSTLPVIVAPKDSTTGLGPETFADYVSAPDFGRGLAKFLAQRPANLLHVGHCGMFWNREGVVDGVPVHDQTHAAADPDSFKSNARPGWLDCISGWTTNNSHFGDFAANHYVYHHKLAIQAARLYRRNRQPACRKAAYTLEGWGQHYLTDSVASGHAWNPPGSYDYEWGFQTLTAVQVRMRIHDYLNKNGAKMAGALYPLGIFWGDHSEEHTADGKSIPEQPAGNPQKELTLKLSRMGLGQVVSAAECGATPRAEEVLISRDELRDVRRPYASDDSMCSAMYGTEITWRWWVPEGEWLPDSLEGIDIDLWGLDIPEVRKTVQRCKWDNGVLSTGRDGHFLARYYFNDRLPFLDDHHVSPTIDPEAELILEELGCYVDFPALQPSPGQRDACGNLLCAVAAGDSGQCPTPLTAVDGCCVTTSPQADDGADALLTTWSEKRLPLIELGSAGTRPGGSAEFIWLENPENISVPERNDFGAFPLSAQLGGGQDAPAVERCGATGSFTIYEARLQLPNNATYRDITVLLSIENMDEGLQIQLNGHLVRYLKRADGERADAIPSAGTAFRAIRIPILASTIPAQPDGVHVLRLTHLNSCGPERPLSVRLALARQNGNKGDYVEIESNQGGCSLSPESTQTTLPAMLLLGLVLLLWRRRP